MGLPEDTKIAVGTSMIDAHAGSLGMLATRPIRNVTGFENQLGIIAGTSACHMALSRMPKAVPGVWGPYYSAVLPSMWLNEGGQSAVGYLLDHLLETHPSYDLVKTDADNKGIFEISKFLVF